MFQKNSSFYSTRKPQIAICKMDAVYNVLLHNQVIQMIVLIEFYLVLPERGLKTIKSHRNVTYHCNDI